MSEPAGWYGNPDGTGTQRYWDGTSWTHGVRPIPAPTGFDPGRPEVSGPGAPPVGAEPATGPPPTAAPAPGGPSASVSDVVGILFDLGLTRSISPALARTAYRVGAVATLVVAALFLLVGLQGGGPGAIVALVASPVGALLWLLVLRLLCQAVVERSEPDGPTAGSPGAGCGSLLPSRWSTVDGRGRREVRKRG